MTTQHTASTATPVDAQNITVTTTNKPSKFSGLKQYLMGAVGGAGVSILGLTFMNSYATLTQAATSVNPAGWSLLTNTGTYLTGLGVQTALTATAIAAPALAVAATLVRTATREGRALKAQNQPVPSFKNRLQNALTNKTNIARHGLGALAASAALLFTNTALAPQTPTAPQAATPAPAAVVIAASAAEKSASAPVAKVAKKAERKAVAPVKKIPRAEAMALDDGEEIVADQPAPVAPKPSLEAQDGAQGGNATAGICQITNPTSGEAVTVACHNKEDVLIIVEDRAPVDSPNPQPRAESAPSCETHLCSSDGSIVTDGFGTPVTRSPETPSHLVKSTPAPAAAVEPAPAATVEPAPVAATEPAPVAAVEPAPVATVKPAPAAAVEPAPVAATEPAPVVVAAAPLPNIAAPAAAEPTPATASDVTVVDASCSVRESFLYATQPDGVPPLHDMSCVMSTPTLEEGVRTIDVVYQGQRSTFNFNNAGAKMQMDTGDLLAYEVSKHLSARTGLQIMMNHTKVDAPTKVSRPPILEQQRMS